LGTAGIVGRVHRGIDDFDMPAADDVRRAADALRMLADPTRLNILWALMQGETSVACLADLAGTTPTAVSQHLSKLRLAGLVTNRREGTFIYYALADHHIGELVRQALSHADHHGVVSGDRAGATAQRSP
jgi:DNA-binding transcriptional ArsR family regulator